MNNLTVVILTYNESQHIGRCIESIKGIASDIFILDSFSTDNTLAIGESLGATWFQNKWPGNQAAQFNWGLENLPIRTKWVLRLDADEYLLPELQGEIQQRLPDLPDHISGVAFKRRHIFLGRWMKRGTYPVTLLRLFRYGKAVCEQRWMDEHIQLLEGESMTFDHDFVDHNLNPVAWWTDKHNGYATREAIDLLDIELGILGNHATPIQLSEQAASKRKRKMQYVNQPLFLRSFAYFIYRYIAKGGFLEGKEGFLWNFLQGWWYRTLVDARIYEIKQHCGDDPKKIVQYIQEQYNIKLTSPVEKILA